VTQETILLIGAHGQVGMALSRAYDAITTNAPMCLPKVVKLSREVLDLSNVDAIRQVVQSVKPNIIINAAAYTAVDQAQTERELAFAINATATKVIAEEAKKCQAKLIHYSTDYVYDGTKSGVYHESDTTNPLSVYGQSKLAGEDAIREVGGAHLIFRTSWVYGADGHNFMKTILRLSQSREMLNIVADQFGAPTSAKSIAQATLDVIAHWQQQSGTYHLVNDGETSWHGFAQDIVTQYLACNKTPFLLLTPENILPISTEEYPLPAPRPRNSRLNTDKLKQDFGVILDSWQMGLNEVLTTLPNA
jgi:dTDP-4-dehydrorhamnose reductase